MRPACALESERTFFILSDSVVPQTVTGPQRNGPCLRSGPRTVLPLVLRNSPVAPFSFLRKTDSVEAPLSAAAKQYVSVCVCFPATPPPSMKGAENNAKRFLPQRAYLFFFFNQKMPSCTYLMPSFLRRRIYY